jgi:hypothetical protein
MLGPVFQPSAFGVLLMASIYQFIHKRPYSAVILAVLAATFHPTYLLSAGVLTGTYMLSTIRQKKDFRQALALGMLALMSISPTLNYAIGSFGGTSPATAAQAREILVTYRIPHHAQVSQWLDATVGVKILLVLAALYLSRRSGGAITILLVSSLAALLLTLLQLSLGSSFLALLFPWRLSIYILPLSTAIILANIAERIAASTLFDSKNLVTLLGMLSGAAIILVVVIGAIRF